MALAKEVHNNTLHQNCQCLTHKENRDVLEDEVRRKFCYSADTEPMEKRGYEETEEKMHKIAKLGAAANVEKTVDGVAKAQQRVMKYLLPESAPKATNSRTIEDATKKRRPVLQIQWSATANIKERVEQMNLGCT